MTTENTERDALIELVLPILEKCFDSDWNMTYSEMVTDAILADDYVKAETVAEYGIVFNRSAVFLNPAAHSLEEFRERYPIECGWSITDRDIFLTRQYRRCAPNASEPTAYSPMVTS